MLTSLLAFQSGEIPPYPGDGNPQHDGQPMHCQNYHDSMFKANCDCQPHGDNKKECKDKEDEDGILGSEYMPSKCKTWCRRPACHCSNGCTS